MRTRAKKGRDWWIGLSDAVPRQFSLFLGLEASSVQIESWNAHVPPGLFQTRAYADALVRAGRPELPGAELARLVDLRMSRQSEALDRDDPPLVWAVIAEPALRWLVGGTGVLRDQLEHLMTLAERPNVEIQVLPLSAGSHTGTEGSFTLLSAAPELENYPGCVFVEDLIGGRYYEEPEQLTAYRNALTRLRIQATAPEDTSAYLHQLAKEL
jgi:hypothetical protein